MSSLQDGANTWEQSRWGQWHNWLKQVSMGTTMMQLVSVTPQSFWLKVGVDNNGVILVGGVEYSVH